MTRPKCLARWLGAAGADRFQSRLILMLATGILAMAVSASLLTGWMVNRQLHALIMDAVAQLTGQLAAGSVFALLADDPTVAGQALAGIDTFPGIRFAAILKPDYSPLASIGDPLRWTLAVNPHAGQSGPALAGEDDLHWHFIAPVHVRPLASPYEDSSLPPERLGYVHIAWDKTPPDFSEGADLRHHCGRFAGLRRRADRLAPPAGPPPDPPFERAGQGHGACAAR